MHAYEFIIAVLILVFIFKLSNVWVTQRAARVRDDEGANADLVRRLGEMEERVRVLERIVTDDRFDLKRQFEELQK